MPTFTYGCPDGHTHEHWIHPTAGGGRLRVVFHPDGSKTETGGAGGKLPPATRPCPECGADAARLVDGGVQTNLVSNAFQKTGWDRPGWSNVNYRNGPNGTPATHLRGIDGQSAAYAD